VITPLALALGSNIGDRASHLQFAIARLSRLFSNLRVSSFLETEPEGVGPQPLFLNAAATAETGLDARAALDALLALERERGRERPHVRAPRTLDLDLILFGDQIIDRPALQVPHPRFRERRFVLEPLAEIAAGMEDPVTGMTIAELLERLGG
jgi:2-amino-4-hydroxy-6-hydroxymethyldihydropteridine diphosphokinase